MIGKPTFGIELPVSRRGSRCYNYAMQRSQAISIDPEIQGGTPCFLGTRVPVKSLFDYLIRGRSIDYFLEQFPSVTRAQVVEVLSEAGSILTSFEPQVA